MRLSLIYGRRKQEDPVERNAESQVITPFKKKPPTLRKLLQNYIHVHVPEPDRYALISLGAQELR